MKNRLLSVRAGIDLFCILLGLMFLQAGSDKVLGGQVPEWFVTQFRPTLFGSLPGGVSLSFWSVAILEVVVGALAFATLAKPKLFHPTLVLAELVFLMLGFGLRLSHKYDDAGQLFNYFGLTLVIHLVAANGIREAANTNYEKPMPR
jgi:hypothetical protein